MRRCPTGVILGRRPIRGVDRCTWTASTARVRFDRTIRGRRSEPLVRRHLRRRGGATGSIVVGLLLTSFLLFRPSMSGTSPTELAYSQFVDKIEADQVKTVTIDANGGVTGTLTNGDDFVSQLPVALPNDQLSQTLLDHGVLVTGEGPPSATLLSVILSFLPLLLFVGVFVYLGRRAGRQLAGGLGAIGGNRAKLYDAEKPTTRFDDVAGYEGAKREVQEVVDFLQAPRPLQEDRGGGAEGRAHGRAAGDGEDAARARRRGRGKCPVLFGDGFELRRDVRRRRCGTGSRSVRRGAEARALDRLHRRDRRDRSAPRRGRSSRTTNASRR